MSKTVTTVESDSDSIVLKKLAKGYGWEIKAYGESLDQIIEKIEKANAKIKQKYGGDENV